MKKLGLIVGVSFLAGALFFALTFGYLQKDRENQPVLSPPEVQAEALSPEPTEIEPIKVTALNFAPLVKRVKPAVVKVLSVSNRRVGNKLLDRFFSFPDQRRRVPGVGSGFIISPDGYIITNNHVVQDAIKVRIKTIDEKEYKAKIIGTDPKTDLALVKIDAEDLPYVQLGDSNKVEVGEWVLAIGNPLNQDLTVTSGIISAKGRQLGLARYEDFLQTDAAINQGNSGGPLINMEGKVIGINSAILAPTGGNVGIGFAIPSNMAKRVISDLKSKGRVARGYLGVTIGTFSEEDAKDLGTPTGGVLIQSVEPNSPADKAGLERYDIIVKVNGKRVKKGDELSIRIAELKPGDTVKLEIYRGKEKKVIPVTVTEAPETEKIRSRGGEARTFDLGMIIANNSPSLAREYDLKTSSGVVVKRVEQGSVADRNGVRRYDVILEVNRQEIRDVDDFRSIVSGKRPGSLILLYINRDGDEGMVRFRLPNE